MRSVPPRFHSGKAWNVPRWPCDLDRDSRSKVTWVCLALRTERCNSSSWFAVRSQFYLTSWRYIL